MSGATSDSPSPAIARATPPTARSPTMTGSSPVPAPPADPSADDQLLPAVFITMGGDDIDLYPRGPPVATAAYADVVADAAPRARVLH